MEHLIVDMDEVERSYDGHADALYRGFLFTGVAYDRDGERLIGLIGFHSGYPHGAWREWNEHGQLLNETFHYVNGLHGPMREWWPDGRPKRDAHYFHGVRVRDRQWASDGSLTIDYELEPGSERHEEYEKKRRDTQGGHPVVDIDLETWEFVEHPPEWGWTC
jgi:hypothetical protein